MKRKNLLTLIALVLVLSASSQAVWEQHRSEVYNYLYRMAQKGIIDFNDNIRPLSRIYIGQCLDSLQAHETLLSPTEKKELLFYKQEFSDETVNGQDVTDTRFFRKDTAGRWRALEIRSKDFMLRADPIITAATIQGNGKDIRQYSSGFKLYGYAGKRWAWYFSFNDINEKGTGLDTLRANSPVTGISGRIAENKKSVNFSELRGGISYSWKNGSVSFGQDYLLWGYGENGRMVLSDKAPTYPYIRLDYRPLPWLKFNYTHAWLKSNILDSARSYPTGSTPYGGMREFYISKFMASHSLQVTPVKGLDITFGESMVYSDRLDIGYLIPVLFFKAYDNLVNNDNINAGSNGQLFAQVSSRNHIRNTHLYTTLFIDEIRIATIFDSKKSRNQVGINIGGSVTDLLVPYLTIGAEYTRINPFVYRNLIPAQNYTHSGYVLGDWMGNNADRLLFTLKYTPVARLKCALQYQYTRKGGAGTLDQQYFQQPQPPFLFDLNYTRSEWYTTVSYEWINNLTLNAAFSNSRFNDKQLNQKRTDNIFSIGVSYGL
ncbi:capsule assembly Wzi family protein [Sediminibacterium ginsengisoli]|uniref:Capsule assembly protein Wzi n=1 Tax=Sediminibacterium ginsengisoli TaxID=413434 RepID=A0A1T4N435_9BACT|nr:capsule assembly Wzi family protein [Sediminibacterium ginsengisoli]SJZ73827.1 Capsule assembly protein Wzi [Sediminibacterium ginsengisoli]